jgi:hypothetical protein
MSKEYTAHDFDCYPIWASKEAAIYIYIHGTETYKVIMFSIKDGSLHPAGWIYANSEKLLKLIKKTGMEPTTKSIVLENLEGIHNEKVTYHSRVSE